MKRPWIKWNQPLGDINNPYVIRSLIDLRLFSIRLHKWICSDDDRALHDHPWNFITFVIRGGYNDVGENEIDEVRAPTIRYRKALHKHTVQVLPEGALTILLTGPKKREWGFWAKRRPNGKLRWLKANTYFLVHGHHHPCE